MKRYAPLIACLAGLVALALLLPLFDAPQPRGVRITRDEARAIADRQIEKLGVKVSDLWGVVTWENHILLEEEFKEPERRRRAGLDPIVGPRMVAYQVSYFYRGLPKFPQGADVFVDPRTGEVIGARRRVPNEMAAQPMTDAQARAVADRFLASRKLPGVANPQFEDIRPTVFRGRVDRLVRYRVPSDFPTGRVAMFVGVYFVGDQFAGWMPLEEYVDGSQFRGGGFEIAGAFLQYLVVLPLLLILLVLFLKKYHAGEVGVRTASFLFATIAFLSLVLNALIGPGATLGVGLAPALDGRMTMLAWMVFKFLFYDLLVAVVVFFAWAVGESYARERWGDRLASFDAILRRDAVNATVGRSVLRGLLFAPFVAAAAYAIGALPLLFGAARATLGPTMYILGLGGTMTPLVSAAVDAIRASVVLLLFIIAFFARKRMLWVGVVAAAAVGAVWLVTELPVSPAWYGMLLGFGGILVAAAIFFYYDLLTAANALFFGALVYAYVPFLRFAEGDVLLTSVIAFATPVAIALIFAGVAMLTGREVVYVYEDLAPHVKRIVERERVKAEIDAANRIQAALLPLESPQLSGASFSSHYRAATEIGGDYFDFLLQPTGEIGIAFGDVSGHGLTSGIVMSMAKSALLVQVDYDSSPRAVLNVLNDIVIRTAPKRILMTFFFGLLDPRSQTLRFSSAGHLDPYVYRGSSGTLESLSSWGFPLGVKRRDPFREHTVEFQPGDRLVLYSDGLIEAVDDDGEPFGFERFEQTILENGELSADNLKKVLLSSVRKFTRNRPPEDDQTLVVVAFEEHDGAVVVGSHDVVVLENLSTVN